MKAFGDRDGKVFLYTLPQLKVNGRDLWIQWIVTQDIEPEWAISIAKNPELPTFKWAEWEIKNIIKVDPRESLN